MVGFEEEAMVEEVTTTEAATEAAAVADLAMAIVIGEKSKTSACCRRGSFCFHLVVVSLAQLCCHSALSLDTVLLVAPSMVLRRWYCNECYYDIPGMSKMCAYCLEHGKGRQGLDGRVLAYSVLSLLEWVVSMVCISCLLPGKYSLIFLIDRVSFRGQPSAHGWR